MKVNVFFSGVQTLSKCALCSFTKLIGLEILLSHVVNRTAFKYTIIFIVFYII
jgi:hypothetical protein